MPRIFTIIAAGGSGTRMNSNQNKQLIPLAGKPVLLRTMEAFESHEQIFGYVVIAETSIIAQVKDLAKSASLKKFLAVLPGGKRRQDSVKIGLDYLHLYSGANNESLVLVHDGARCLVNSQVIDRVIEGIERHGASGAAVKVRDTIKITDAQARVLATPDRESLWAMQTPQGSSLETLIRAYTLAEKGNWPATDDLTLLEKAGIPVYLVAGDDANIKITTRQDIVLAEALLDSR